jgi:hypothetical protein
MQRRATRRIGLAWVALAAFGLSISLLYLPCVLDDAFIAFRYASNLAQHGEPTFNLGRPWVEGFSSPLWMLSLSGVARGFGKAVLPPAAAALGFLCFALTLLLAHALVSRLGPVEAESSRSGSLISIALLALCPSAAFYATTGLEPMLWTLLTLSVAAAAVGTTTLRFGLMPAALATWVRPEGPFLLVPLALVALRHPERRRDVLWLALSVVAGSAALVGVRLALFGSWLPNTFYAKSPEAGAGLRYLFELLLSPWALAPIVLGNLGALWAGGPFRTLALIGWSWLLAAVLEGGDWMPLGRFALPAIASFAVAAAGCGAQTASRARVSYGLLAVAAVAGLHATSAGIQHQHRQRRTVYHENRMLAGWLARAGVRSVALMDIGEPGFVLDSEIIDLAGLTDDHIGRASGSHLEKRLDTHYVLSERHPDAVVIRAKRSPFHANGSIDPEAAGTQPELDLLVAPTLLSDYGLVFSLVPEDSRTNFYGKLVFVRKGMTLPESAKLPGLVVSVSALAD